MRSSHTVLSLALSLGLFVPAASAGDLTFGPPQYLLGDTADGLVEGQQHGQDIAAGGPGFMVVWSDARASLEDLQGQQGSGYDVYGAILDANGDPLVRSIVIDEGPGHQEVPSVAWNGTHFLVVWIEDDPTGLPTYQRLRGVRVAPDGTVVDPAPILIDEDDYYPGLEGPSVASSGPEGWMVVYPTNDNGLRAAHVAPDGSLTTPPQGIQISTEFGVPFDVVFASGQYLVIRDGNFYAPQGYAYTPTLQFIGTKALPFADQVATDGTNFLVVDTNDNLWPPALQAVLVDPMLNVLAGPLTVKTGTAVSTPSGVGAGFDGTNYWVTWAGEQFARVTPAGVLLDPGGISIPLPSGSLGYEPDNATAPGGGLQFVWHDGGGGLGNPEDVYTARLAPAGSFATVKPAAQSAPSQVETDFARGAAGVHLAVFRSRTSGAARILAQRVDDDGVALDTQPIEVASGPVTWLATPQIDGPGVAWNGSVFLVTWSDKVNVYARRMAPSGMFLDASPIVVMTGQSSAAGALGTDFLVTGATVGTLLAHGALRGVRIDGTTGAVLDATPIAIGGVGAHNTHVEPLGSRWLVVWESVTTDPWSTTTSVSEAHAFVSADGSTTGSQSAGLGPRPSVAVAGDRALLVAATEKITSIKSDIEGRILMADGSFLGPAFPISTATGQQFRSGVGWTGTEFVAAWEDQRHAVSYFDWRTDIFGARISATGTVLDPAGVPLATTQRTELAPDFLTTGSHLFLSLSTLRSDTTLGSFRVELRPLTDTCQPDLGFGGPGTATLSVCGDPLSTGNTATLSVVGVQPQALIWVGFGATSTPTPLFGGTIVPVPLAGTVALLADATGTAKVPVPGGGGPLTIYAQAVYGDLSLPGLIGITNAVAVALLP